MTGPPDRALRFDPAGGGLEPVAPEPAPPLVADSWLVDEGRVRGLDHHWARFAAGVGEVGGPDPEPGFRAAVAAALPRAGRWFPRVELRPAAGPGAGELRLLLRATGPAIPTARAWLADRPDPRLTPRRKGPDIDRLAALRAEAVRHGGDEAVITDADGTLLEGGWTSLLWWEDDVLCAVDDRAAILPGVTRALLLGLAADDGVEVRRVRPARSRLDGREAWLTSALHGIREVTAWLPDGPACGRATRAPTWRARLDALARPVDDEPAVRAS